jgi:hypothetical protein
MIKGYHPAHPLYDRMCRLNSELSLQVLTSNILFAAYVIRVQSALPECDRVIDVERWSAWLEARRNWFSIEAQMAPDKVTVQ